MRVSVAVMAHHSRAEIAAKLYERLLSMDFAEQDVAMVFDNGKGEWETGRVALEWGIGIGDWHLVLQDDAVVTEGFFGNLEKALSAVPERSLVSLYTGQSKPIPGRVSRAVAKAGNSSWLKGRLLYWGVGIAVPTEQIEPLLETCGGMSEPYDTRIGMAYHGKWMPVWYTAPSLVDHDDSVPSLLGHGASEGRRIAHNPASGPVEWNGKYVEI